jgi:hypothetical protein
MRTVKIYTPEGEVYLECGSIYEARQIIEFEELEDGYYYEEVQHCKGCDSEQSEPRYDAYGYSTGSWCNDCYDSNKYPYRKDKYYDYLNAGEHLE